MPRLCERYSLAQFWQRFATEEACLDHLEQARWPHGPVCPRCGVIGESSRLTARPRVRQCAACRKQFSVTAHTPLHKTHLPLNDGPAASVRERASQKRVTSQLADVTQ